MLSLQNVERRTAIKSFAGILAGVIAGPTLLSLLQSCEEQKKMAHWIPVFFDDHEKGQITEIADLIIPETDTPSASDAGVPIFIDQFVGTCLPENMQKIFTDGLKKLDDISETKFNRDFLNISKEDRVQLLTELESKDHLANKNDSFFKSLKELVITGYFKSKIGATEALTFIEIPMEYHSCIPLEKEQRSWGE